ncbi:YrvL family regulatory protein [Bacillus sp. 1P06AnD]|uniref:YrvL family regulatory protein n=1 Tax=Bacillus sp. 1P06AnD TaxID=3132208 RepID=UPI0039A17ECC
MEKKGFKRGNILFIAVLTISLLIMVGICFFIYAGFLSFFGFEYQSARSLILFLFVLFIGGGILEWLVFLFRAVLALLGMHQKLILFLALLFELAGLFMVIHTIDRLMVSISIPESTEALFALCLVLLEWVFKSLGNNRKAA